MRQDPDVIMVGEIRDGETAEIAIRAALTGHLVFSTLHTNDAPSSVLRLIDMGIPSYLVAGATRLIMAQRMTRKICENCREEIKPREEQIKALSVPDWILKDIKAFKGRGCSECNETGLSGRTGIYEVMPVSRTVEQMILSNAAEAEIRDQAVKEGMLTLRMAAVDKMKKGIISIEEVFATTS